VPHDAQLGYVDLGDGTIQYYFNDEAMEILRHMGVTVASAKAAEAAPSDMASLIHANHYRPN
jgi:delta-aminolevulinic acid dehydratase/porphobilinogen synthase